MCGLHKKWNERWVCGDTWKSEWVIWIMKFNEAWWIRGHGTFCANKKNLLGTQLQICPIFKKLPIFKWQFKIYRTNHTKLSEIKRKNIEYHHKKTSSILEDHLPMYFRSQKIKLKNNRKNKKMKSLKENVF